MTKAAAKLTIRLLFFIGAWNASTSKPSEAPTDTLNAGYNYGAPSTEDLKHSFRTHYAAQMMSYMNPSVKPCDDFYEYACGNWKNVIDVRQSEKRRNNLLDTEYKLVDIAERIIQMPNIDDIAPEYSKEFMLAQKFYTNCLNTDLSEISKSSEYLKIIENIGGFPAVNPRWNPSDFSWLNMSAHMSNYGIPNLVEEGLVSQFPFTPYYLLPILGFDIELHYENIEDKNSNAYQANEKTMRHILSTYGVAEDQIVRIVDDIFEYLKALLHVYQDFDEDPFKCESLGTVEPSNSAAIEELWLSYFDIAWMGKLTTVDDDNKPCSYLYYKLNNISEQRTEAVANYLSLKFLYHMDAHLKGPEFQREYCISKIRNAMIFLIDHLYMKVYVDEETLEEVRNMITDLRKSFRTIIEQANWLDEPTREAALLKESALVEYVGRYEDSAMTKRLIGELQNLQFVEGNYDANNLNLKKFEQFMSRYNFLHIDELSNATKPPQLLVGMQINAFYYIIDNAIYVMAGVLQPPIFHKSWPNSLQYGTLGYLVGHELTHGFDTVGATYDHLGMMNPWWSEESKNQFNERSQCFIEHFGKYFIPEIKRYINGNITRDENIADAGGLRVAFTAYHRFVDEVIKSSDFDISDNVEKMPGIDLSPDQLFFLGTAQIWCASYEEANYWTELTDEHTIDKYRVLGMVANNADFAKAYNCPLGSKLNPREKCKVW